MKEPKALNISTETSRGLLSLRIKDLYVEPGTVNCAMASFVLTDHNGVEKELFNTDLEILNVISLQHNGFVLADDASESLCEVFFQLFENEDVERSPLPWGIIVNMDEINVPVGSSASDMDEEILHACAELLVSFANVCHRRNKNSSRIYVTYVGFAEKPAYTEEEIHEAEKIGFELEPLDVDERALQTDMTLKSMFENAGYGVFRNVAGETMGCGNDYMYTAVFSNAFADTKADDPVSKAIRSWKHYLKEWPEVLDDDDDDDEDDEF